MSIQEFSGLWWLPSNPDSKIGGILSVDNDSRITLQLIGSFNNENMGTEEIEDYPIVHGVMKGSSFTTLVKCITIGSSMSFPGYSTQKLLAHHAYQGVHFKDEQEIRFNQMYLSYNHLPEWLGLSGFEFENKLPKSPNDAEYVVRYKVPQHNFLIEDESFTLTLSFGHSLNPGSSKLRDVMMGQNVLLRVDSQTELSYEEWHTRFIYPLRNFLTFATLKPNTLTQLTFFSPRFTRGTDQTFEYPVELVLNPPDETERLHQLDMLFDYKMIEANSKSLVKKWLQIAQELDSVCHLFLGTQYRPSQYLEQNFLNVAQAVESFHRRRRKNRRWTHREFLYRRDSVLEQLTDEYKDWVRQMLLFANEPNFVDRVMELLSEVKDVIGPLLVDQDEFARLVKNTRNYYVHWTRSSKSKTLTRERLYRAIQILVFMLQTLLLIDMGVSKEQATEFVTRTQTYQHLVQQSKL